MDDHQDEATPILTTVANFRDVSKFVKNLKPGLLFRSAQIGEALCESTLKSRC
jgi:protein-tyrosine phosphatase